MKILKSCSVLILLILALNVAFGMVTNSNQSAEYIRMLNRNASVDIDAVLFNPAGLTKLDDGMHLYLSSQTIWQSREVRTKFPNYNSQKFTGLTFVPAFPNAYLAYKKDKLAFSAGLIPIGGGGSAEFDEGLPSFDYQLARLVGLPAGQVSEALDPYGNITGYSVNTSFNGSSIYFAGQAGVSYALNDMVSLAVAARYIYALNTYGGSLSNSVLEAENGDISGFIPDLNVDSKRTGSSYTGIIGLNLSPIDGLNIGLRYEHMTKLEIVSDTKEDGTIILDGIGMFPDGVTYHADIPGQIGAGISYQLSPKLKASSSFNYFMNTQCDWDGKEEFVNNDFDIGLGIEYNVSPALTASLGYLFSTTGAMEEYQSDQDFSLAANAISGGIKYALSPKMVISLGALNSFYIEGQNDDAGTIYEEKYMKTAFLIAAGFHYRF